MPAILFTVLATVLSGAVARVLLGAGLAIATYTFVYGYVADALDALSGQIGGIPADITQILAMAGIGDALGAVGSAMLVAAAMRAASVSIVRAGG